MRKPAIWIAIAIIFGFSFGFLIAKTTTSAAPQSVSGTIEPVFDTAYYHHAKSLIDNAKESVELIMFTFKYYDGTKWTDSLLFALQDAGRRGAEVRVVLEGGGGEFLGKSFTSEALEVANLLEKAPNVDVRFDEDDRTTHAKLLIVDGKAVLVGSTNWTISAFKYNHEANVLFTGDARPFEDYFDYVWSRSHDPVESGEALSATVIDIVMNPEKFDGRRLSVTGVVDGLRLRRSRAGNPYATFSLCEGDKKLKVYTRGHPPIHNGQLVVVTGVFRQEKRVGRYVFKNEIDAESIEPLEE